MAALDFPASPTLNQLATLTNGFTYQWDGAVWTLAASTGQQAGGDLTGTYPNPTLVPAQKNRWMDSGVGITPVDPTDMLIVPGSATGDQAQIVLGNPKMRLQALAGGWSGINWNDWYDGTWHQDDTSKPSWHLADFNDTFYIERRAANNGAATMPLQIDGSGALMTAGSITAGGGAISLPGNGGIRCQNIAGVTGSTYSNVIGLGWNGNLQARVDNVPIGTVVVTGAGTGAGNLTVTRAMLAVGAASTLPYSNVAVNANQTVTGGAGWVKITPDCSITLRGGVVIMALTAAGRYIGGATANEVVLGWGVDGNVTLGIADYPISSAGGAGLIVTPIPGFVSMDYGKSGAHTYSAWAWVSNTNGSFQSCPGSAYFYVVELS